MFVKRAKVPLISTATDGTYDASLNKVAFKKSAANSVYAKDDNKLNLKEMLSMVASEYNISAEPSDYIFEAARAVTSDVPNENGDAFPKSELLRFDHRLGKAVYQTFILKPHHINHRADNPKTSRGVVLDASYNDTSPALENCPTCNNRTAEAEGRDASGLGCKKCGETVKDEFVELLIAIDTKKDPTFAAGVKTGALDSLSMGCTAGFTDCSICDNRARTASQFCAHIKTGKKKQHKTASGMKMSFEKCGEVVFTEISRVDQPADPTALQREVFTIDDTPYQLQAESEILMMSARMAKIEASLAKTASEEIGSPVAPFRSIGESIKWAEISASRLNGEITRLTAEKDDKYKQASSEGRPFYAWEAAAYNTQIKSAKQYVSRLEDYIAKARVLEASGEPWAKNLTKSMSRFFASKEAQFKDACPECAQASDGKSQMCAKCGARLFDGPAPVVKISQSINDTLDELGRLHPELYTDVVKNLEVDTGVPGPMSIDDYVKKIDDSKDHSLSSAEMGIKTEDAPSLPSVHDAAKLIENKIASDLDALYDLVEENNVKTANFANAYGNVLASVTSAGNVKVYTKAGSLFVIQPDNKPLTKEGSLDKDAATKLASSVLESIANDGLVATVQKYKTALNPKMAQVLQHNIEDFAGGREKGDKKPITDGNETDMQEALGKPEKSLVVKEHTDRKDEVRKKRDQSNADVLEDHEFDHVETTGKAPDSATEEEHSDKRENPAKKPKTTLDDIEVDMKDKLPKKAQMDSKAVGEMCAAEDCDMEGPHTAADHEHDMDESEDEGGEDSGPPSDDSSDEGESEIVVELDGLSDEHMDSVKEFVEEMLGCDLEKFSDMLNKKLQVDMNPAAQAMGAPAAAPAPGAVSGDPAAGGMAGGPPQMPMVASKTAGRIERLYKSRLEKAAKENETKVAGLRSEVIKEVQGKFVRAMTLAAKRQVLNLEDSPLKAAMFDTLASEIDIDSDTFYPGMDSVTASAIVETAAQNSYVEFVDSLVKRAVEFIGMSDDAFKAIEADVKNLKPVAVVMHTAAQKTASVKSDELRKEASKGNLLLAPVDNSSKNVSSGEGRNSIKAALGHTKVSRASNNLIVK